MRNGQTLAVCPKISIWAIVDVDTLKYEVKAEKINITLPRRLLAQIDEYAQARGESRSGFLAEAARAAMHPPGINRRVAGVAGESTQKES